MLAEVLATPWQPSLSPRRGAVAIGESVSEWALYWLHGFRRKDSGDLYRREFLGCLMRFLTVLLLPSLVLASATFATDFASLKGPYLGQKPPGATRALFAPGILSDGLFNGLIFFSEGGEEVFFSSGFEKPFYMSILFQARIVDGGWTEPLEIPLGRLKAFRPVLAPGGKRIYFISSELDEGAEEEDSPIRIYYVDRDGDGWSTPRVIDFGDAFPHSCGQVSVAASGSLYFQAGYHIDEDEDIWFAEYEGGRYRAPMQLGDTVNTADGHEVHPVIASDESYLLFDASREAGYGMHDLYVSFPDGQGGWTAARNLGPAVNTAADERRASVSNDGKYLFFESKVPDAASRLPEPPLTLGQMRDFLAGPGNGGSDIYWVDASVIEKLRP